MNEQFTPGYWEQPPTEEELQHNQRISEKFDRALARVEEDTPAHPETGEVGFFVRFVGAFPHIKPVYRTAAGEEFFLPVSLD